MGRVVSGGPAMTTKDVPVQLATPVAYLPGSKLGPSWASQFGPKERKTSIFVVGRI